MNALAHRVGEPVDLGRCRVPGAHPAHHAVGLVPDVERVIRRQRFRAAGRSPAAREPGEDAVGLDRVGDLDAVDGADRGRRAAPPSRSRARAAQPEVVARAGASNWAETKRIFEASWPSCLRVKAKSSAELGVAEDDRLAEEEAVLGAAEGDDVDAGVGGELAERDAERGGGVGEAGAVDVEEHAELVGDVGDRARSPRACRRCRARSTG